MIMDLARKDFSTAPEYFIAGTDIGIAKATKTASAAVEAHAPVLIEGGKVQVRRFLPACMVLPLTVQRQTKKCRFI